MNREEVIKDCYKIINLGRKGASFPMKIIKEQLSRSYNKGYEEAELKYKAELKNLKGIRAEELADAAVKKFIEDGILVER